MKKIYALIVVCCSVMQLMAQCPPTTAQADLDINNVRARILNGGDLWWDPVNKDPFYEVPVNSGKMALYAGSLWIGGIDPTGQLLVAAQTYRQAGANDFYAGPLSKDVITGAVSVSSTTCSQFDRIWKLNRADIISFAAGGPPTMDIIQWPGNGDVSLGQLPYLAPFFDANGDGIYNYQQGDYPYFNLANNFPIDPVTQQQVCDNYLFGDQSLWWVFNDVGGLKTETNSAAIGLEVRAQAYAYASSDEDLNNTTFYRYQIINRNNDSLNQTSVGLWCDPDLGNASDDYVGCDVGLGLGYVYNGDPDDDGGTGYGLNPPACGIDFMRGPDADANDGIDNDRDGVTDEPGEQIIMSNFQYYKNLNNQPDGNPATTDDYYQYMNSYWCDGQQVTFGGDGRNISSPATNFMFSNGSDPMFPGQTWNMLSASIQPDDMRWLQSAGHFTMGPGEVNYICSAVIWARDTAGGPLASLAKLLAADIKIQSWFDQCFTTTAVATVYTSTILNAYPNPFTQTCTIDIQKLIPGIHTVRVANLNGQIISEYKAYLNGNILSIDNIPYAGTYLVNISNGDKNYISKITKL